MEVANFVGIEGALFVAGGGGEGQVGFDVEIVNALFLDGNLNEGEVGIERIVAADGSVLWDGADVAISSGRVFFDVKADETDSRAGRRAWGRGSGLGEGAKGENGQDKEGQKPSDRAGGFGFHVGENAR